MHFQPKKALTLDEIKHGLKNVTIDGYTSQIMVVFTSGTFLIAYALLLGASNFIIGLLASLPQLVQLIRIPIIKVVNNVRNRRKITLFSLSFYRISLLLISLIPFIFSFQMGLLFLIFFTSLQSFSSAIAQTAWSSWMHDLIPQNSLGVFYSHRMMLSTFTAMICSLAGAFFIEIWNNAYSEFSIFAYSILFFVGFCFGLVSIYIISKIPEPEMLFFNKTNNFRKMLSEPFKEKNYRNLIIFLIIWNFAVYLSSPFYIVYMFERLQFDISLVIMFIILSQSLNLLFYNLWGRISDKYSNKSVLVICCPLYLISVVLWPFTTLPEVYFLTIPLIILIYAFMGISMAGILLSLGNINLKLTPKGHGNIFLNIAIILTSLSLGIAPILGGLLSDFFKESEFSWTFQLTSSNGFFSLQTLNLRGLDFCFILTFFLGLLALYRLALVREEGEVRKKLVIQEVLFEIRKTMRTFKMSRGYLDLISSYIFIKRRVNNLRKVKK